MALKYNLVGQRFGSLVVTKYLGLGARAHENFWECECDCGRGVSKCATYALVHSMTTKCMLCAKDSRSLQQQSREDLTGKVFGKLKVITQVPSINGRHRRWLCECQCDNHTQFEVYGYRLRLGRTTQCKICADKARSKNRSGEKNALWRGGISFGKYCPLFNEKLKEKIRERYGRECFICGKEEGRVRHHVHHVDYQKNQGCRGRGWSLVPLCPSCHAKTNHHRYYWFNLLYPLTLQVSTADYELLPNWGEQRLEVA